MKIICLHPNLLRRMLEPLGTTEIQRFQGAHGSAAAAAMAPLPGVIQMQGDITKVIKMSWLLPLAQIKFYQEHAYTPVLYDI